MGHVQAGWGAFPCTYFTGPKWGVPLLHDLLKKEPRLEWDHSRTPRKHRRLSLRARVELLLMNQFILSVLKKPLDDGVVVTVPFATHAGHEAGVHEQTLVRRARIQRALIGVMDQARLWTSMHHCHPQGLKRHADRAWHSWPS